MADWEEIDERTAVIRAAVNIGVIRLDERSTLLVDTGIDRDSARRAVRMVAEAGLGTVAGILTTHAHADHVGGNAEVVRRTGCPVWASPVEAAIARCPELGPALLYGASAPATMRGKFLLASPSPVDHIVTTGSIEFGDLTIGVVRLPGHSPDQIGYTLGNVCFAADIVFPQETIDKYRVPFIFSVTDHRSSLQTARTLDHRWFVSGHGPVLDGDAFHALIDYNAAALDAVETATLRAVETLSAADEIEAAVLRQLGAKPPDIAALALLRTTIRSVIADLADRGLVTGAVHDGRIIWRRAA